MEYKFIKHPELSIRELEKIIDLKKIHWKYSTEEHNDWIKKNINDNDIHVLMFENEILVGYMNLVQTEAILNNEKINFSGIGNVCSKEKGKGYGKHLLVGVNNYLSVQKQKGLLLCKDDLVVFYEKFNWKLIDKKLTSKLVTEGVNFMVYDINCNIICFDYTGRNF